MAIKNAHGRVTGSLLEFRARCGFSGGVPFGRTTVTAGGAPTLNNVLPVMGLTGQ